MELSGSLREMDFAQLIGLVAHMEGILDIWKLPRKKSVRLFIKRRKLRCVQVNGEFVEPLQVKLLIAELASQKRGIFEFTARSFRTPCETPLNWPLDKIMLAVFTQVDERERNIDHLPEPAQRFVLTPLANVEGSLFLRAAGDLLKLPEGASAKEIARQLKLPLDQVRYYLHKLHERGKVKPADM